METECDKNFIKIINFNKFNESINKYNEETNDDFEETLTKCDTKGGALENTKLNKYFFMILRCLIFSVVTEEILKEFFFLGGPLVMKELSVCFIILLKFLLTNGCLTQVPIVTNMCPNYINLFIDFLNNLEIILIKLGPIIKYGIGTLIYATSIRDIYNDSKIYYYLLNHPEFIDDIEYPENTVFIVNKYNYPKDFVESITNAIIGATQPNSEGDVTESSTNKTIPKDIKKLTYRRRMYANDVVDDDIVNDDDDDDIPEIELDEFITPNNKYIYLNPIYTRFYINIGYLTVSYISEEEAKNEITKLLKDRKEKEQLFNLLELKYNIPELPMRNIAKTLGEGYRSSLIKRNTNLPTIIPRGGKQNLKRSRTKKRNTKKSKTKKTKDAKQKIKFINSYL
jgi:hypothetical protein